MHGGRRSRRGRRSGAGLRWIAAVLAVAAGLGCGDDSPAGAEAALAGADGYEFEGVIVEGPGEPLADGSVWFWVSSDDGPRGLEGDLGLVVRSGTEIDVRIAPGLERAGDLTDLTEGARVRAWTTDVEYLSIPPAWDAVRLLVL